MIREIDRDSADFERCVEIVNAVEPDNPTTVEHLREAADGDFLLHEMASLGDGITSGAAGPRQMRTAPLWGVRGKSRFLHDGRAETIAEAIELHDGQAAAARNAFNALTAAQQEQVVDFLNTI